MSFSSEVKLELLKQCGKARHCMLAELAGILQMVGDYNENDKSLNLSTENENVIEKCNFLIKELFNVDLKETGHITDEDLFFNALKMTDGEGKYIKFRCHRTDGVLLKNKCCKRAYLRGAFMASGSISDPAKSYHFEIVCSALEQATQIVELIGSFDAEAMIVERKGHYVVYLKEGAQIVDMLNVMEAYVSLMKLENVRILKEISNSVNRKVNCEAANISKTVNAAVKQLQDIQIIEDYKGIDELPRNLKEMAIVRLENPDASLKELGEYLDPPVGKSGVNHRLRKLGEIADELRERYNIAEGK